MLFFKYENYSEYVSEQIDHVPTFFYEIKKK